MKKLALQAVQKAGQSLLRDLKRLKARDSRLKSKHEALTSADLRSQKIILSLIRKKYPTHSILSEEAPQMRKKNSTSDWLWIVDPLDGTTNFSIKIPLFSVSLALAYRNKIILGVVYAPYLQELFVAEAGRGAFLNNKPIHVSRKTDFKNSLLTYCHSYQEKDIKWAIKIYSKLKLAAYDARQLGAASLELAWVATGRTESILIPGANLWDVAAGILLVQEAGGKVTDFKDNPWHLKSRDMLASNGLIHSKILKVIKRLKLVQF